MAQRDRIAIDITSEKISIIIGTRFKILNAITIETPKNSYSEDNIIDVDSIRIAMEPYIGKGKIRIRDAYFIVRGDDLIVRNITLPYMKEVAMRESVEWELTQFVGERSDEYNVSYEVSIKKDSENDGNCEVLMVAVEKTKINKYLELGKALGLNIKGLDICASASARIVRSYNQLYIAGIKSVGVLDLSANSSSLTIIESGKVKIEKYQGYGILSASSKPINNNTKYEVFLEKIDLTNKNAEDFTDDRLETLFSSLNNQFNGIIQFYSSGKIKKSLDKILLVGSGSKIEGIDKYFESIFNTQVEQAPTFEDFKFRIKISEKISGKIQLKDYFYVYGLLLKTGNKELNLLPIEYNKSGVASKEKNKKNAILVLALVVIFLVVGLGFVEGKKFFMKIEKEKLIKEITENKELMDKEVKLNSDIELIKAYIQKAATLDDLKTKETNKIVLEMQKHFPSNVKTTSVIYDRNSITIAATSTNQDSIEQLWANLRESDEYKNSHVGTISGKDGEYIFNIIITLNGGVIIGNS